MTKLELAKRAHAIFELVKNISMHESIILIAFVHEDLIHACQLQLTVEQILEPSLATIKALEIEESNQIVH